MVLLCLALIASSLCKYTIRDVGFVFIGPAVVEVGDGGIAHRPADGATRLFPSSVPLDGGAVRLALSQDLLDAIAVVVVLPGHGEDAALHSARAAANMLEQMSDEGKLARALDAPVFIDTFDVHADPLGAWGLGWSPDGHASVAVLYGRGRLAGPVLHGGHITTEAILDQLELVSDSCECDRPRSWLQGPHLPMPWDDALRTRARDRLGFDPHSPRIRAEMDKILARGPQPDVPDTIGDLVFDDPLLGYDELQLEPAVAPQAVQAKPTPRFSTPLFWLCVGLGAVVVCGIGMSVMSRDAA